MNAHILLFMLPALLIFLGAHFLVSYSFIHFFKITGRRFKFILIAFFLFSASSFFLASAWAHYQENIWSIAFYSLASFWLGLLTNLFLASLLLWIFYPVVSRWNAPVIAGIIFFSALIFSLYGVWNAMHPRIKNIDVTIPNLPAAWQGKKVVHLSDIHLGHVYGTAFAEKLAQKVNGLNPDIVFITGDLFDGMDGNLLGFVKPLSEIRSRQGIFFVTGNHETYLGVDKTLAILQETNIRVLDDSATDIDGLQIIGYSYPPREEEMGSSKKDLTATVKNMAGFSEKKPTVLLHHAPTDIEAAKNLGVNLQLSGHTHLGQLFPFNLVTHLIYKGYDYGLHVEGAYSIYTTNGVGTWGPPMRTFNTPEIVTILLR